MSRFEVLVFKMASRGTDQFYLMLTSDGCMDVYPDNKTSSFRISLKNPIDVGERDWEVCLQSINYPYSWTNVGPSAKVYMKYYINHKTGPREINFPNWQCKSVKEVVEFVGKEIQRDLKHSGDEWGIWFTLDELGRFKIASNSPEFDVGFSPNMLKLLGLAGHSEVKSLSIDVFEQRQKLRDVLATFWKKNSTFNYWDLNLRERIMQCTTIGEFYALMLSYIDSVKLGSQYEFHEHREEMNDELSGNEMIQDRDEARRVYALNRMMSCMKDLLKKFLRSNTIRGITPGIVNPVQRMYIYTNIMQPIDFNEDSVKLLKLVNTQGESFKTTQEDFSNPTYFPLLKGMHSMISVLITDENGDPVSFQTGTVVLTLHFRRARR